MEEDGWWVEQNWKKLDEYLIFLKCEKIQISLRRSAKERLDSASASPQNNPLLMYQTSHMS